MATKISIFLQCLYKTWYNEDFWVVEFEFDVNIQNGGFNIVATISR